MRRTATAAALLLALLVPACSGGSGRPKAGPVAAPSADDDAAASVDQVLAGLDGVMGDLQRILVRDRKITPEVTDRLKAIYTGPELLNQIDAFRADVAQGLIGYKNPPGNRITTVTRLITLSSICVFAQVSRDYAPVTAGPDPRPSSLYVVLVTKTAADDPKQLNPTPWAMLYDGVQDDGSQPEDICR
jgi:hypothetical protein